MLDLLRDIENELDDGWEAASRAELKDAEETRRAVARVARAFAIVVVLLLVFSSGRLVTWVNGFEVGPLQNAVVALSSTWHEQMSKNGFDAPAHYMDEGIAELCRTEWSEVRSRLDGERARTRDGARLLRGMMNDRQG